MIGTPLEYNLPHSPEWTEGHSIVGTFDIATWDAMIPYLDSVFEDNKVGAYGRLVETSKEIKFYVPDDYEVECISGKLAAVKMLLLNDKLK